MLQIALLGAGRIGAIHAKNVAQSASASLRYVADVFEEPAERLASAYGARALTDPEQAFTDPAVDAVIVATPTDTHVELITRAAAAGKAIFAEKPIDLSAARAAECVQAVEREGVAFFPGFNRRFDPSFRALHDAIGRGEIDEVEVVAITSRDPRPPPIEYVRRSGGIFRDMTIHDFDLGRWLLGEEPVEVFAAASALIDPAIAEAGDADTAAVIMKTARGALCTIGNSRRAAYGYDQRIEVLGERGMLRAENAHPTTVERWTEDGVRSDAPFDFFLERYAESYRAELEHFIEAVSTGEPLLEGPRDGVRALLLAEAAQQSVTTGRPVSVPAW